MGISPKAKGREHLQDFVMGDLIFWLLLMLLLVDWISQT
jgi:hypothetical protein